MAKEMVVYRFNSCPSPDLPGNLREEKSEGKWPLCLPKALNPANHSSLFLARLKDVEYTEVLCRCGRHLLESAYLYPERILLTAYKIPKRRPQSPESKWKWMSLLFAPGVLLTKNGSSFSLLWGEELVVAGVPATDLTIPKIKRIVGNFSREKRKRMFNRRPVPTA